jgi:hypothetical protein
MKKINPKIKRSDVMRRTKNSLAAGWSKRSRHSINRYSFEIGWDPDANSHLARCVMFPSLRGHGNTPEAALKEIKLKLAQELWSIEMRGEMPPLPTYQQIAGY